MKANRIREQTGEELTQLYADTRKAYADLRMKKRVGGDAEQPLKLRTLRREIARIKTVMREREIASHG